MADLTNARFFESLENARECTQKMVTFYDETAISYNKLMAESKYNETIDYTCELLKNSVHQGEGDVPACLLKIADVGCGSGLSGVSLKDTGFTNITGVDPSPGMLEKARKLDVYTSLKLGKLTDDEKFDFGDSTFDGFLCCECISHGHIKLENAIPEFLRLLKDGGVAVYTVSPTIDHEAILKAHLKFVIEKKCEVLRLEKRFYLYADGKCIDCTVMVLKKL